VIEQAGQTLPARVRWLLVAAVGIALISIALLMRTIQLSPKHQRIHGAAGRVMLISAFLILPLGFSNLNTIPLLILLIFLMLASVFFAFRVWIEKPDQAD
jgi:hypothetical protein